MNKYLKALSIILSLILLFTITSCNIISSTGTDITDISDKQPEKTNPESDGNKYILEDITIPDYEVVTTENVGVYVAAKVIPATVVITCNINFSYSQNYFSFYGGTRKQTYTSSATSQATGMVINEDGYIITNAHVVCIEGSSSYPDFEYVNRDVYVNYADSETQFPCTIITYNEDIDLCILKMDITNIENLQFVTYLKLTSPLSEDYKTNNNAVKLLYGEVAVAIGNANGYGISVTKGVVSAPVRQFTSSNKTTLAIQTDTAINSGNSGGPLCDQYGNVIGVNSFKIVTSTSEGLGYAIPSYVVLEYIDNYNKASNAGIKYYTTNTR